MLILPIQSADHRNDMLVVALDDTNLERMAAADPAEVVLAQTGMVLVNPRVLICHEKDSPEFTRVLQTRDLDSIVKYLRRGFEFRPDLGDHDDGPQSLSGRN